MAILGTGTEEMRLPLVPVSPATRRRLEILVGELGLLTHAPAGHSNNLRMF